MEKLLLEQKLEQTLAELGMSLGERVYAEDLDMQAEIEDLTSETKSSDYNLVERMRGTLSGELQFSEEQLFNKNQPYFIRSSEVYNELGFQFSIESKDYEEYLGGIRIYYDPDLSWQLKIQKPRYKNNLINKFYDNPLNILMCIAVSEEEIIAINFTRIYREENYKECGHLQSPLEKIESLKGKTFSESTADELMQYIRELKGAV